MARHASAVTVEVSLADAGQVVIDTATGTLGAVPAAYHRIAVRHSGKCLHVANVSQADGAALTRYPCGGEATSSSRSPGSGHRRQSVTTVPTSAES